MKYNYIILYKLKMKYTTLAVFIMSSLAMTTQSQETPSEVHHCDPEQENDDTDEDRIQDCSSQAPCAINKEDGGRYSLANPTCTKGDYCNAKCSSKNESCSK